MKKSFLVAYNDLDLEDKRKYFNKELLEVGKLLEQIEYKLGLDNSVEVGNYEKEHTKLSEDEMLTYFYHSIFNIQRELKIIEKIINEDNFDFF